MSISLARPHNTPPIVWSIAGSDPCGGAGVQADLKTITALGAHACTIITSVTAQNSGAVSGFESVSPALLAAQIDALRDDMPPKAIKIGMLGNAASVRVLAQKCASLGVYTIYDPVMISSSGAALLDDETLAALRSDLLPHIDLLTPNGAEATALTGIALTSDAAVEQAAKKLRQLGAKSVLIKGWNSGAGFVQDYFYDGATGFWLTLPTYNADENPKDHKHSTIPLPCGEGLGAGLRQPSDTVLDRLDKPNQHPAPNPSPQGRGVPMRGFILNTTDQLIPRGTGCAFASAIAAAYAHGHEVADATVIAKAYVHRCIRTAKPVGKGFPIAQHEAWPVGEEDFPWLTMTAESGRTCTVFPDCGAEPLGFYPVVDSLAWLQRLLPLGVRTAQLRVKNLHGAALEEEIRQAILLARTHDTRLFINDYWELAIKHRAYGVHLGQEDLDSADIAALQASGLRLGISTHAYAEAARAHALRPSYIALGPIFPTTLKSMRFAPQGVDTLRIWRQLLPYPLVAIGGIKLEQAQSLYAAGADSIAVVSDITQNADPEGRVREWLKLTKMREWAVGKGDRLTSFS